MSIFETKGVHGYSVEFSPYNPNRLACAASQNFGIAGGGQVLFLDVVENGQILFINSFKWDNGIFDVTWSESNENIAATGSGDGSIQLWDVTNKLGPLRLWKEHTKEVHGIDWSQTRGTNFMLSASWDKTVKLWDATRENSLATFPGHTEVVYCAVWAPLVNGCFASTSGDKTVRIWDIRKQYMPQILIPAHNAEILTCDWCKYNQNLVMTAATDGIIRGWDLRNYRQPVFDVQGHDYGVKRLKCSPFQGNILATCSYDFTVRIWDIVNPAPMEVIAHHTEFVCGLDFNMHRQGQIVDCAWDRTIKVYTPKSLQSPLKPEPERLQ